MSAVSWVYGRDIGRLGETKETKGDRARLEETMKTDGDKEKIRET